MYNWKLKKLNKTIYDNPQEVKYLSVNVTKHV